jgi:hypothetical protein
MQCDRLYFLEALFLLSGNLELPMMILSCVVWWLYLSRKSVMCFHIYDTCVSVNTLSWLACIVGKRSQNDTKRYRIHCIMHSRQAQSKCNRMYDSFLKDPLCRRSCTRFPFSLKVNHFRLRKCKFAMLEKPGLHPTVLAKFCTFPDYTIFLTYTPTFEALRLFCCFFFSYSKMRMVYV